MILMNRDKSILKFIEKYKSITINQCSKVFYTNNKYAYYQARKRLKLLSNNGFLKRYRQDMRSETIYYIDRKLSFHDLKVLDIYAYLKNINVNIKYFKQEYTITCNDKEYRMDGFIECIKDGYFYPILIEIDYTHFTSIKKLTDIYNSEYFQNKYKELDGNIFPTIVIVRPMLSNITNNDLPFKIIYIDLSLVGLDKLFD